MVLLEVQSSMAYGAKCLRRGKLVAIVDSQGYHVAQFLGESLPNVLSEALWKAFGFS